MRFFPGRSDDTTLLHFIEDFFAILVHSFFRHCFLCLGGHRRLALHATFSRLLSHDRLSSFFLVHHKGLILGFKDNKLNQMRDYLKHWRIVRQWAKKKYGISMPDLELLLFLYSERYFTASQIREGGNIMSFDNDRARRMVEQGWMELFRKRRGKGASIYQLSFKSKGMIRAIYNKLDGEPLSESGRYNPLFRKDARYSEKTYRNLILRINETIRQQQHPSQ